MHSKGLTHGTVFAFSMKMRTVPADEVNERIPQEEDESIFNESFGVQEGCLKCDDK